MQNGINDETITGLTDKVLLFFTKNDSMTWYEFEVDICGNPPPPNPEQRGYHQYIGARVRLKDAINDDLIERKDARRLIVIHGKGLRLAPEDETPELIITRRIKKQLNAALKSVTDYTDISDANNISDHDLRLLKRMTTQGEMSFDGIFGNVMRMRLLSEETKQQLQDEYGYE